MDGEQRSIDDGWRKAGGRRMDGGRQSVDRGRADGGWRLSKTKLWLAKSNLKLAIIQPHVYHSYIEYSMRKI